MDLSDLSYTAMRDELKSILNELQRENIDLDIVIEKYNRAKALISEIESRLLKVKSELSLRDEITDEDSSHR